MADWKGYQFIISAWLFVGLSTFFVAIRLYINIKGIRKVPWYRDALIVTGIVFYFATAALETLLNQTPYFSNDMAALEAMTDEEISYSNKLNWVEAPIANTLIYFIKADLLLLFHDLAPRAHNPKMFILIMVTWFFTIASWLIQLFELFFWCRPLTRNWNDPEGTCVYGMDFYASTWVFHMWSDLLIYLIPSIIVFRMQKMSLSQKLSAAAAFIVGFINILCVLFVFIVIANQTILKKFSWSLFGAAVWMLHVQWVTGFLIVCMPQLRSMYKLIVEKVEKRNTTKEEKHSGSTPEPSGSEDAV